MNDVTRLCSESKLHIASRFELALHFQFRRGCNSAVPLPINMIQKPRSYDTSLVKLLTFSLFETVFLAQQLLSVLDRFWSVIEAQINVGNHASRMILRILIIPASPAPYDQYQMKG